MLFVLLGLHAACALAAPLLGRRLGRGVFLVCGLAPAASAVWLATQAPAVLGGAPHVEALAWARELGMVAELRLDSFAWLFAGLVSGIGALIFAYAHGYFAGASRDLGPFAASLTGFAGAMLGLVLADNLFFLFLFWELTSITSYLLIGFDHREARSRDAALQALLTTVLGGLALLGGLVLIGQAAGTYSLSAVLADPPAGGTVAAGLVLCLLGAFTKSAQVPFHPWLPAAMVAPTPVSAYLHSATMVKGGVFLVARFAPAFADAGLWQPLVLTVGSATMLVGAYRALRQTDLKLLLAYSTVSQLGFLTVLFGAGIPEATFAGVALLLAHSLFKAALFMVAGVVDHEAGTRDLRRLTGLWRVMPATFATAVVAAASMAGLPPLFGFIAKEAALKSFVHAELGSLGPVVLGVLVVGSMLTFAYSARFVWGGFASKPEGGPAAELIAPHEVHRPPAGFAAPAAVLAGLTVLFGLVPGAAGPAVNGAAVALDGAWHPEPLALWHGLTPELGLSGLVVAVGAALFAARRTVERAQGRVPGLPSAAGGYQACVHGLQAGAIRLTAVVQNGSLPIYLAVISLTLVALPGTVLVAHLGLLPSLPVLAANPVQAAVAVGVIAAAAWTAAARRRFPAVLLLGAVGYGVMVLFVIQGAPDLALTQLLVETLALVIFVLVFRHLPARFARPRPPFHSGLRAAVAGLVGVFVFAFALVAAEGRRFVDEKPVSAEYLARTGEEASGHNVVNVILVDFRALDTLGEITVLVVAAMAIAALVSAGRRAAGRPEDPDEGLSVPDRGVEEPAETTTAAREVGS